MAGAQQVLAAIAGDIFDDSSESSEEEEPLPRMQFTLHQISERNLFQQTRLDRQVFLYVLEVIRPFLMKNTRKGRYEHLTPMHKLYVALQFYASGSFQWLVGSSAQISQSAVSNCITEVTNALVNVAPQFIHFPRSVREYNEAKQAFYQLGLVRHGTGFPNVLGVIDCTHCRLQAPTNAPEQYLNRHLYHSINVQLISGPTLKIYNVLAELPGSNHDSYIWSNSAVRNRFVQGGFPEGWLVGDSGYPQEPWLMTPVTHVTSPAEHLYNSVHISTRNPIERTNGVLKSRWRVLDHPLAYKPGKVCQIITACCVLHNICTQYNLDVEDLQEYPLQDDLPCQQPPNDNFVDVRRDLIARHFTQ